MESSSNLSSRSGRDSETEQARSKNEAVTE